MANRKSIILALTLLVAGICHAGTWTTSTNKCPSNVSTMLQLRDGRLLMQVSGTGGWLLWSPDPFGNYQNGTCTRAADMPLGYAPNAQGSVVAPNGKAYIFGGEYNNGQQVWTNLSAVYTPDAGIGSWRMIDPPPGWKHIGDAPALLLPNGKILQVNCCTNETAEYNIVTESWESPGTTLLAHNNEVMTVLMQNGKVVMVDTQNNFYCGLSDQSTEIYDPATHQWSCGPQTPVKLWGLPDNEAGVPTLLPNGQLFWTSGGTISATASLNPAGTFWSEGPIPQDGANQDDAASALLPDGTVLGVWRTDANNGCQFRVYDPDTGEISDTANPSTCPEQKGVPAFRLTVMPDGTVAFAHAAHALQFYSSGQAPLPMAAPRIIFGALGIQAGKTYTIYGIGINGLSCASFKDDDSQQCTNYPLVQLIDPYGHITFGTTHDDSYSGIAQGTVSYTKMDVPVNLAPGQYSMRVVTNGIASNVVTVRVIGGQR